MNIIVFEKKNSKFNFGFHFHNVLPFDDENYKCKMKNNVNKKSGINKKNTHKEESTYKCNKPMVNFKMAYFEWVHREEKKAVSLNFIFTDGISIQKLHNCAHSMFGWINYDIVCRIFYARDLIRCDDTASHVVQLNRMWYYNTTIQ